MSKVKRSLNAWSVGQSCQATLRSHTSFWVPRGLRSLIPRDEPRNQTFIPHGRSLLTPQHNITGVLETLQCKSTPSTQLSEELVRTDNDHKGFWSCEHQLVDFYRSEMRFGAKPPRCPNHNKSLRNSDLWVSNWGGSLAQNRWWQESPILIDIKIVLYYCLFFIIILNSWFSIHLKPSASWKTTKIYPGEPHQHKSYCRYPHRSCFCEFGHSPDSLVFPTQ